MKKGSAFGLGALASGSALATSTRPTFAALNSSGAPLWLGLPKVKGVTGGPTRAVGLL